MTLSGIILFTQKILKVRGKPQRTGRILTNIISNFRTLEKAHVRWLSVSCKNYKQGGIIRFYLIPRIKPSYKSNIWQRTARKKPNRLINNCAFEENLTCKDMLAVASRRVDGSSNWLPLTYNMNTELSKFITYWKQREDQGLPNIWIIKPWNLSRSIDMTITSNLNEIIRCQETGPKVRLG